MKYFQSEARGPAYLYVTSSACVRTSGGEDAKSAPGVKRHCPSGAAATAAAPAPPPSPREGDGASASASGDSVVEPMNGLSENCRRVTPFAAALTTAT